MENLHEALKALYQLKDTIGSKAKEKIIVDFADNESFRNLLFYACHPRLSYKVSETTLRRDFKNDSSAMQTFTSIFEVLKLLATRKAVDDTTLCQVFAFLQCHDGKERELYIALLSKTLRLGLSSKTINKAIPGLIPEWNVQQAYPIEKYPFEDGAWFCVSEKLNGVRATFYRGDLIGRSGVALKGLRHITDDLSVHPDVVFDGELTLFDKDGLSDNEAFRKAVGIINSNDDKTGICFTIFDVLPVEEFDKEQSTETFKQRLHSLRSLSNHLEHSKYVYVLPQIYEGKDRAVIPAILEKMVKQNKEGLMVNLDVPYQCKRHKGILKVKQFYIISSNVLCKEKDKSTAISSAFI